MSPADNRPQAATDRGNRSDRTVIKIGGHEIDDPVFLERLTSLIKEMSPAPILVHGGGKEITDLQDRLGIHTHKIEGLRVTDAASLRVTEMVLSGLVNKRLVRMLVGVGLQAIGISGVDAHLFRAEKMRLLNDADLGFVGTITAVNIPFLEKLLFSGFLPVVSPLSLGDDGQVYNVNADSAAQALAEAMQAETLVFLTNVPGVKIEGACLEFLHLADIEKYIDQGEIMAGMIPKVRAARQAVERGVGSVVITNAPNFLMGKGTRITL
jgi:acetylglutamate kinase